MAELSLETTIERFLPRAREIMRRFRIPLEEEEDIAQDVLVDFLLRREKQHLVDAHNWLLVALRHRCLQYWRRRQSREIEPADYATRTLADGPLVPLETHWRGVIPISEWAARRAAYEKRQSLRKEVVEALVPGTIVTLQHVDPLLLDEIVRHPHLLKTLHWRKFEEILAEVLGRLGYAVELQRGTKDGGIDIFAVRQDANMGPHRYLLQAKRWRNRVGVAPVREILFLHDKFKATKSCLAITSEFTEGAWNLAQDYEYRLELRDLLRLKEWIAAAKRGRSDA